MPTGGRGIRLRDTWCSLQHRDRCWATIQNGGSWDSDNSAEIKLRREKESQINVDMRLIVDFERDVALDDLQQLGTIQDVLTQMEMGPIQVQAEPVYKD